MRLPFLVLVVVPCLLLAPQDPLHPDILKRAQQLARAGAEHARLARLAGTWDIVLHTSMPGEAERTDRGTVVGKAILGGRFVVLNYVIALPDKALEGVQILGFDNLSQQYTASWRDDHSTWAVECAGSPNREVPERIQLRGSLRDARDPNGRPFRFALTLPAADGDNVAVAIHDSQDGVEFLLQTQEWTRK